MAVSPVKERLYLALRRVQTQKQSLFLEESDFTRGEFFCLSMLCRRKKGDRELTGLCVSEIADHLRVLPPAVSRILRRLEDRGLILRSIDPADRRNILVTVTPEGEALWRKTAVRLDGFTDRLIDGMGERDMLELVRLLERLSELWDREKEGI